VLIFSSSGNITDSTFNFNYASFGGAIDFEYPASASNCNFNGNTASQGGGIYFTNSDSNATNCTFVSNSAVGSSIYTTSSAIITNCLFMNNLGSSFSCGTIYSYYGYGAGIVSIINSYFSNNTCSGTGGAAINTQVITIITNSTFIYNSAVPYFSSYIGVGGCISSTNILTVTKSVFTDNVITAPSFAYGGAIYNSNTTNIIDSTFTGNSAFTSGGAIFCNTTLNVLNSTFIGNNAINGAGGGIYSVTGTITNSTFTNNNATSGGGLYIFTNGLLQCCTFTNGSYLGSVTVTPICSFNTTSSHATSSHHATSSTHSSHHATSSTHHSTSSSLHIPSLVEVLMFISVLWMTMLIDMIQA